jgi:hypothetical protein
MSEKTRSSDSTPKGGCQSLEKERIGFKSGFTRTLSGRTFLSGAGIRSGLTGADDAMAADAWSGAAAQGFQLAPRIYVLDVAQREPGQDRKGEPASPLDELPIHLTFREASTSPAGEIRQAWLSDESARWHWRLTVGSTNGRLVAELTATSPGQSPRCESGTWQASEPWQFFGVNDLLPCDASKEFHVTLTISAP